MSVYVRLFEQSPKFLQCPISDTFCLETLCTQK